jgi:hypothetical protein
MALNFPQNPTTGDVYQTYVFDGTKWVSEATLVIDSVAPAFNKANDAYSTATLAFDRANVANTVPIEKSGVLISSKNKINFIEGTNTTITITDDSLGNRTNITISASGSGGGGGGGGSSEINTFFTTSSSYTMTSSDQAIISNATTDITITLPSAAVAKSYYFFNGGSGSMTLETVSSQLINNDTSLILRYNGSSCRLVSTGSKFLII